MAPKSIAIGRIDLSVRSLCDRLLAAWPVLPCRSALQRGARSKGTEKANGPWWRAPAGRGLAVHRRLGFTPARRVLRRTGTSGSGATAEPARR
jgi:hypothetical protein